MSKEHSKSWKARNSDRVREQKARWYAKHREEILARQSSAGKSADTLERNRAYNVRWREENKDRKAAYERAYNKANPQSHLLREQRRRALKAGSDGNLSKDIIQRLLKSQKGLCVCCGANLGEDYELDHIMPLALGGPHSDLNVQLLTGRCNAKKNAKHPIDYMQSMGHLL